MTLQFCFKFIFVFGFLQFVTRVHCNDACDGGESHNTNVLERAFGNVLTTRLEKQSKATEEMFEIKMADHRDELNEIFDSKQEEQRHQIGDDFNQILDAKFEKQRDGFVQVLDDKMTDHRDELLEQQKDEFVQLLEQQKNDFVQLLDAKMEQQMNRFIQRMDVQFCPPNWNKVVDSCILLSSERADFDTAIEKCKDLDAKLYEPQSLSHNQMVYALIEGKGLEAYSFWIGIHDKFTENLFVYQSNNQTIAFKH